MSTKSPQKRAVTLDPDAFNMLEKFAKERGVTLSHAASCFVHAGLQSTEATGRAEELIETREPEPYVR